MNKIFTILIIFFLLAGATAVGLWMAGALPGVGKDQGRSSSLVVGVPQIGGPFSLVNHNGERVTEADFKGKLMLVFFGFTHCPDVCPTELQTISVAMQELGDAADQVTPVFITVDPERDTQELMADFVEAFDPSIVGLTGSQDEIADVGMLLFELADNLEIDLGQAILAKVDRNEVRYPVEKARGSNAKYNEL